MKNRRPCFFSTDLWFNLWWSQPSTWNINKNCNRKKDSRIVVFWKIFHAHSLKDTSQFLLKTTCGPCIFDFTGPNLRYPHVVFCWGQRWWKPLLGTSLVRSQCGGDVGFATSRCIGVSAIRSKVNQPKLQTWLVGEKTHWLHTVTFCLNLIYIYIFTGYTYICSMRYLLWLYSCNYTVLT